MAFWKIVWYNILGVLCFTFIAQVSTSYAQTPKGHFLYLFEWGEGGPTSIATKVDHIYNINPIPDGYVFSLFTFCQSGNCVKYVKIE